MLEMSDEHACIYILYGLEIVFKEAIKNKNNQSPYYDQYKIQTRWKELISNI